MQKIPDLRDKRAPDENLLRPYGPQPTGNFMPDFEAAYNRSRDMAASRAGAGMAGPGEADAIAGLKSAIEQRMMGQPSFQPVQPMDRTTDMRPGLGWQSRPIDQGRVTTLPHNPATPPAMWNGANSGLAGQARQLPFQRWKGGGTGDFRPISAGQGWGAIRNPIRDMIEKYGAEFGLR